MAKAATKKIVTVVIVAPYPFRKEGKKKKQRKEAVEIEWMNVHIQDFSVVLREVRRVLAESEDKKAQEAAAKKEDRRRDDKGVKAAERTSRNLWRMDKRLKRLQLRRLARVAAQEELSCLAANAGGGRPMAGDAAKSRVAAQPKVQTA